LSGKPKTACPGSQKQQKVTLGANTVVWLVTRAVSSFWLGGFIFLHQIFVF